MLDLVSYSEGAKLHFPLNQHNSLPSPLSWTLVDSAVGADRLRYRCGTYPHAPQATTRTGAEGFQLPLGSISTSGMNLC